MWLAWWTGPGLISSSLPQLLCFISTFLAFLVYSTPICFALTSAGQNCAKLTLLGVQSVSVLGCKKDFLESHEPSEDYIWDPSEGPALDVVGQFVGKKIASYQCEKSTELSTVTKICVIFGALLLAFLMCCCGAKHNERKHRRRRGQRRRNGGGGTGGIRWMDGWDDDVGTVVTVEATILHDELVQVEVEIPPIAVAVSASAAPSQLLDFREQ